MAWKLKGCQVCHPQDPALPESIHAYSVVSFSGSRSDPVLIVFAQDKVDSCQTNEVPQTLKLASTRFQTAHPDSLSVISEPIT